MLRETNKYSYSVIHYRKILLFNFAENWNFVETFLFFWIIFSSVERIIKLYTIFFIYITENVHFTLIVGRYVV